MARAENGAVVGFAHVSVMQVDRRFGRLALRRQVKERWVEGKALGCAIAEGSVSAEKMCPAGSKGPFLRRAGTFCSFWNGRCRWGGGVRSAKSRRR